MKKILKLFTLATSTLFISCGPSKKVQALKAQIEHLKKDSIETHHKLNEKKTIDDKNKASATQNSSPGINNNSDTFTPLPPIIVANVFKSNYPLATEVAWALEIPLIIHENNRTKYYKVNFSLGETKNSIIYSENGNTIELKEEILTEQLPPNIYKAIKNKYPDAYIVSAAAVKKSIMNASYAAIVRPYTHAEHIEVMLKEDGTFLK